MAKRQKNKQHNGQKTEEQTTQWPKDRRTDNTMAKRKSTKHQYTMNRVLFLFMLILDQIEHFLFPNLMECF
jgi:hypothetical protein